MNKIEIYNRIQECGIMPTTFVYDVVDTAKLARTLYDSGIHVIELLQRTPHALEAIKTVKEAVPQMVVGAGTVLTEHTAAQAIQHGADYIVSPFYEQKVVDECTRSDVAVIPGCATITEVSKGYESGLRFIKYFPVNQLGGVEVIRQISEIFNDVRYIVTGGITYDNLVEYAQCKYVAAIGSVCMMPKQLIEAHDWVRISELTAKAVAASLGFELAYVADEFDKSLYGILGMMSGYSLGRCGILGIPKDKKEILGNCRIGVYTNSIIRAAAYFENRGIHSNIILWEADGTPAVAEIGLPAIGELRLVARHYMYKT